MSVVAPAAGSAGTRELRERVMEAADRGVGVRIIGAGTWLEAGRPVRATAHLVVGSSGIVDYTPGDLTLTARSGTSLAEIARLTAQHGQWLALDPFGAPAGTIGATVATASAGPLAHAYGTPRDQVLGLEVITGTGALVHAGGRVVKNVAGFDLARLFTGSWGTLGVITEVTVRLRALPEHRATLAIALASDPARRATQLAAARRSDLAPIALEAIHGSLAHRLGLVRQDTLLARVAGNAALVRAQRDTLARLGPMEDVSDDVWMRLLACEPARAAVVRFSRAPAHFPDCWDAATRAAGDAANALIHGTPSRGIARAILPTDDDAPLEALLATMREWEGRVVPERLPPRAWAAAALPGPIADRLSRGIRERFDPMHVLNPGVFGSLG